MTNYVSRFFPLSTFRQLFEISLGGVTKEVAVYTHGNLHDLSEDEVKFVVALVRKNWAIVFDSGLFVIHHRMRKPMWFTKPGEKKAPLWISDFYGKLSTEGEGTMLFDPDCLPDGDDERLDENFEKARQIQWLSDNWNKIAEPTHERVFYFELQPSGEWELKSRGVDEPATNSLINDIHNRPDESNVDSPVFMDNETRAAIEFRDIKRMEMMDELPLATINRTRHVEYQLQLA